MDKNIVIAIVLGVLIVIAGVQAYSLMSLKSSMGTQTTSAVAPVASAPSSGGVPSNIQNLPQMVGGC